MPVVVIAEKPSVATDIAKVLGVGTKKETHWESDEVWVTWAVGHLLELKTPEEYDESFKNWRKSIDKLPFIPDNFQLKPITGRGSNRKQLTAIKKMIKNKSGKIINITSIVGHTGNFGQTNYSASKAGIVAFSKSLALEYAKKNININCVSPGFIKTEMTDKIPEEYKKMLINKIPAGDLGTGDDVSNCVAFLASDKAKYINGETIHVNGGMYMA